MDFFSNLCMGFSVTFSPINFLFAFTGAVVGTAIGVLPGLGTPTTIALLLPMTYSMDPTAAIILMAGIFYGAMYGGSTTSILLNIPGEAASVVTCLDGYKMARNGKAGKALGISAMGSFIAGSLAVLGLALVAPPLTDFALKFGPAEYTSLVFLGLLMAVYLSEGSTLKGLQMMGLGLVLANVGIDPIFGQARFTLGIERLLDGINIVVVGMGLFGIGEVLINMEKEEVRDIFKPSLKGLLPTLDDWRHSWAPILRGSFVGFFIGILPGGGATISSFISYALEKRISRRPKAFGKGVIEGVAAPESANNAASTSSFIPLLTLGIPGNASTAMIFVALMIHGIQPGPFLLQEHPQLFWGVIASMYIGNIMLLGLNLPLIGLWVRLLKVPYYYMATFIIVICVIGAFSLNNAVFDIGSMLFFGVLGFFLRKGNYPMAPLALALVLGDKLELSFIQSMQLSAADPMIFIEKPISASLLSVAALMVLIPLIKWAWQQKKIGR